MGWADRVAVVPLLLCLAAMVEAQNIADLNLDYDGDEQFHCASGQWPDLLQNVDGFLELQCHTPFDECDRLQLPATCDRIWRYRCLPRQYVAAIRRYFTGREKNVNYKVQCCSHPILKSEYFIGEQSQEFDVGADFNAVAKNQGKGIMEYLANVYSTAQEDHQRIKIGMIYCNDETTTTDRPTTPTTRRPREDKDEGDEGEDLANNYGYYDFSPEDPQRPPPDEIVDEADGDGFVEPPRAQNVKIAFPKSGQCYGAASLALTRDGARRLDSLRLGDEVLVAKWDGATPLFEPIVQWLHADAHADALFYRLSLSSGAVLTITPLHMLPIVHCDAPLPVADESLTWLQSNALFAERASIGDCLVSVNGLGVALTPIANVSTVRLKGIYAPVTASGTIVVDSALTSCYSSVENHLLQHTFFTAIRSLSDMCTRLFSLLQLWPASDGLDEHGDVPIMMRIMLSVSDIALSV